MKTLSSSLPIVILSLIFIGVWGLGLLAVKASATSTQISLDLLRQHLKVAQLHEKLLETSKQRLEAHVEELAAAGALTPQSDSSDPSGADQANRQAADFSQPSRRPWPQQPGSPSTLETGLKTAQPVLDRLAAQVNDAVMTP